MAKILVTGAGGNVGRYMAESLFHAGHEVVGIYRSRRPPDALYECIQADLSKSIPQVRDVAVILHIAAGLSGSTQKLVNDNIMATRKLISFAQNTGVSRFVYMSTVSVYGNVAGELCETSSRTDPDCYGVTKYISECLVRESLVPEKMVLQLPRMLGPFVDLSDTKGSGFLTMAKKILHGETVNCHISQAEYNNYLHVSELAEFMEQLLGRDEWPDLQTVVLGAGERMTMLEILRVMREAVDSGSEILWEDKGIRPKCALIHTGRAKELGFCPDSAKNMLQRFMRELRGAQQRTDGRDSTVTERNVLSRNSLPQPDTFSEQERNEYGL